MLVKEEEGTSDISLEYLFSTPSPQKAIPVSQLLSQWEKQRLQHGGG